MWKQPEENIEDKSGRPTESFRKCSRQTYFEFQSKVSVEKKGKERKNDCNGISNSEIFKRKRSDNKYFSYSMWLQSWKSAQDLGHLDANHVILRRMTNTQRILVGQMCASLKTKRINNQGLIRFKLIS